MKLYAFLFSLFFLNNCVSAQWPPGNGIIIGNVLDKETGKPLAGVTVSLRIISDTVFNQSVSTDKVGIFSFEKLPFAFYSIRFSAVGYSKYNLDSIHVRQERFDFDLNDILLSKRSVDLEEVVVYAEKPLVEQVDGKIVFNTGESALSNGATTTELLKQTPLVNVDNEGKITMRGKEAKILIDDKPVELDARQLQELMESMPGSMIEKIEVMTTPPPQFASERGGVINIVTKKGRVGLTARLGANYGTRGEAGINGSIGYRKKRFTIQLNTGFSYRLFNGGGSSIRKNIFADSVNYFVSSNDNQNVSRRPNARLNVTYDINKKNNLALNVQFNSNSFDNTVETQYRNQTIADEYYNRSERTTNNAGLSINPNINLTYTRKFRKVGEEFKVTTNYAINSNENNKIFFQQFLNLDNTFTGIDSSQIQFFDVLSRTKGGQLNYDNPLKMNKLFFSTGGNYVHLHSQNKQRTVYLNKFQNIYLEKAGLSNDVIFDQIIITTRAALKYNFTSEFSVTAGVQFEHTSTDFELDKPEDDYLNKYWSVLPYAILSKRWENDVTITVNYKRTVQRPGINEMNPGIDYTDPYNLRYGNPFLLPYYADNFDWIIGKWNKKYFANFSIGYNSLQGIYSSLKSLQENGTTVTTWQNISGRKEYEINAWGGYTFSKKSKANLNVGYTYNTYSQFDKQVRGFVNGGSFYTTCTGNYQFTDLLTANYSVTYNRFANPQGSVRNNVSMNLGIQRRFFQRRLSVNLNIIDPFTPQQNRTVVNGTNFMQESINKTNTRNVRFGVGYNFRKKTDKKKPAIGK